MSNLKDFDIEPGERAIYCAAYPQKGLKPGEIYVIDKTEHNFDAEAYPDMSGRDRLFHFVRTDVYFKGHRCPVSRESIIPLRGETRVPRR